MTRDRVLDYFDKSIATYDGDPPANDYQRGHLDALKVARAELASLLPPPPIPNPSVRPGALRAPPEPTS